MSSAETDSPPTPAPPAVSETGADSDYVSVSDVQPVAVSETASVPVCEAVVCDGDVCVIAERVVEKSVAKEDKSVAAATDKDERAVYRMATTYLTALADYVPVAVRPAFESKGIPLIAEGAQLLVAEVIPFCVRSYESLAEHYERLKPHHPELLAQMLAGLVLCFFGGSFATLIAACEAFRQCGAYESVSVNGSELYEELCAVWEANVSDDKKDEDNDGVADVEQLSGSAELVKRKTLLLLRTVDPQRITGALVGINTGLLAVVAVLQLRFARTLTLSQSIAEVAKKPVDRKVLPALKKHVPEDYQKWLAPVLHYLVQAATLSIAFALTRIVQCVHSALTGGLLLARSALKFLAAKDIFHVDDKDTYADEVVGYGIAVAGILFQLTSKFGLPFPLNVLLWPLSVCEYLLVLLLAK